MRSEELAIRFGQNLRRCRHLAGLSQEELGERAALHRTEIGMLEHGQRVARIDTLIRLAGAMAIPPGEMLEGIHWSVGDPRRRGSFSFTEPARAAEGRRRMDGAGIR
ncbi:MAG TPA: helix-turn-helix transcriptional regulator [Solirubrobacterales bacterium]|nr:helix-turn-helix transcriptional regulator [Solirubrobacterales bacterium]